MHLLDLPTRHLPWTSIAGDGVRCPDQVDVTTWCDQWRRPTLFLGAEVKPRPVGILLVFILRLMTRRIHSEVRRAYARRSGESLVSAPEEGLGTSSGCLSSRPSAGRRCLECARRTRSSPPRPGSSRIRCRSLGSLHRDNGGYTFPLVFGVPSPGSPRRCRPQAGAVSAGHPPTCPRPHFIRGLDGDWHLSPVRARPILSGNGEL